MDPDLLPDRRCLPSSSDGRAGASPGRRRAGGSGARAPRAVSGGRPPAPTLEHLALVILEVLPLGVALCDAALDQIRFVNGEATRALATLGGGPGRLTRGVRQALSGGAAAPGLPCDGFTAAVAVVAPGGERFFVRGRALPAPVDGVLVLLTPARLRHGDLVDLVHRRLGLSRRKGECVALVRTGLTNKEIAAQLGVTAGTVRQYLSGVYAALEIRGRTDLVKLVEDLARSGDTP